MNFVVLVLSSIIVLPCVAAEFELQPLKEELGSFVELSHPEKETKGVRSEEWEKKNKRDAEAFWRSYDGLLESVSIERGRDIWVNIACDQLEANITENSEILHNKRLSVFGDKNHMVTPLGAVLEAWSKYSNSYKLAPKFESVITYMLKLKSSSAIRINGLCSLIKFDNTRAYDFMQEALFDDLDLSHSPELIVTLVERWCVVNEKPVAQQPVKLQISKKQKKTLEVISPSQDIQPVHQKITFKVRETFWPLNVLRIAQLLVRKGAPLTGLRDDFPPADHAAQCDSCFYLRNRMADIREGWHGKKPERVEGATRGAQEK